MMFLLVKCQHFELFLARSGNCEGLPKNLCHVGAIFEILKEGNRKKKEKRESQTCKIVSFASNRSVILEVSGG